MSAAASLTAELRREVLVLEDDLRGRVDTLPAVLERWRNEYDAARAAGRTAASWEAWRDERVTLAAVAWVLTTVFVRFCEDNGLVKQVWMTKAGSRSREATDAQAHFLREAARTNPDVTDREWLLEAVDYLKGLPATAGLVDETSPMWLVAPSGDAATRLLSFWRERGDDGLLVRDMTDAELDTRFLGDLYQDISEDAKKRYALLQTPVFVEEFILDRTLEPALAERRLEGFKAIDPTCGSGHFLLGIFTRLLSRWHGHAPGIDERERVQRALDAVHGVDLNPFAVAIARFRLTVTAIKACGITRLEDAPAFKYHLAAGDSLLHGLDQAEFDLGADMSNDRVAANFSYATENLYELRRILRSRQYDCVVGNPPYITVKDPALNRLYRERYSTCHRQYALTVPFMERFFDLARSGPEAGWAGQITSNSFMKREFGSQLIENFLPSKDLRLVVDTSGAYIPGHGTPTVIVVGRNRPPAATTLRAVLGVRGEPARPENPARGRVWSSIVDHVDQPDWSDDWVSVSDLERSVLATHPWSLTGGGAVELSKALANASATNLSAYISEIGSGAVTREDAAFMVGAGTLRRFRVSAEHQLSLVEGDATRDWMINEPVVTAWPYSETLEAELDRGLERLLWPNRALLSRRVAFGKSQLERGLEWFEYSMFFAHRFAKFSIAFAEIATANHFVLDRGGKVFKQTAPVIKLAEGSTEDEHLALLGVLNSSTASFWLRQNSHNKGEGGGARVDAGYSPLGSEAWKDTFAFTGTTLREYPIPGTLPLRRSGVIDGLAQDLALRTPLAQSLESPPSRERMDKVRVEYKLLRARMVAQQEELDWEVYSAYGLVGRDLTYNREDLPALALGERAFELLLARRAADGSEQTEWFTRFGSVPVLEIPGHWPVAYRELVQRRIELIRNHPYLGLLEKPEHKRRWASESWEKQEERALRGWLLDRLEDKKFWVDAHGRPTPKSIATLADEVARDAGLVAVLAVWEGRPDVQVVDSLAKLLAKERVPYLAAYRYKEPGLRKRAAWEHTWVLQRGEDSGTYDPRPKDRGGDGPIPLPPKYSGADFARVEYWSHRGKLDVPKERFILYPEAGRDTDPTPVLGWAGWDHAQQALALATLIQQRQDLDGWSDEQLVPLVAGLAEVLPWVQQWHSDPSDLYGGVSPAEFFAQQLEERMAQVSATRDTLQAWRPAPPTRGRKNA